MTTKNQQLREAGYLPVKWKGTVARLKALGIEVQKRDDARTASSSNPAAAGGGGVSVTSYWAPRWAVLVSEAEPCNETAREWALEEATKNEPMRQALETISRLTDNVAARAKMADYIMEIWTPEGDP